PDGWAVTLLEIGVQPPTSDQVLKPRAGNQYVYAKLSAENGGRTGVRLEGLYEFKVQDANGIRQMAFAGFLCITCRSDLLPMSLELGPDGHVTGTLMFEAPIAQRQFSLVYQRSGYEEVTWYFPQLP